MNRSIRTPKKALPATRVRRHKSDLLTIAALAEEAGVYHGRITAAVAQKEIPVYEHVFAGRGHVRPIFRRGDVQAWINERVKGAK